MFYSHFILARKGPLGTVWMAAHLQHKLRKSQVTETNISASVDSIMFPDVPIALRLSGHLLLGVVRIYSTKVDYLHHDCHETLTKLRYAFASIEIDLPEDASTAPVHTITIPETLELDAVHVDQAIYGVTELQDIHIRSQEYITIPAWIRLSQEYFSTLMCPLDGRVYCNVLKRKHFPPMVGQYSREVNFECGDAEPPIGTPLDELEIEQQRSQAGYSDGIPAEMLPSKNFTPSTAANLESAVRTEVDSRMGLDLEREVPASAEPDHPGIDVSATDDAHQFTPEETPEFRLRHLSEDLGCLEADASQAGTTQDRAESWSVRTRAVAQYLKKSFKGPLDSPGRLNLSIILEGRRRKECARMFYEVLVLKSRGCIEVDQEKPYDDIMISHAPGLTNIYL